MGNEKVDHPKISLVIFTCTGREHLLYNTINSFRSGLNYNFHEVIVAIDGQINPAVLETIAPDIIVQHYQRKGYVHSITRALNLITAPYFFWLEDDWAFKKPVNIAALLTTLQSQPTWAQIILSKYGPLDDGLKVKPLGNALYETTFGFSANPCICDTTLVRDAFKRLADAPKGSTLGEDGFENFLTKNFKEQGIISVIADPEDHSPIAHEGYLETTPRNWHMTNSLEQKTSKHLLTIPAPSFTRKIWMAIKLTGTFFSLAFKQFFSNKIYEYCFRIIATAKSVNKDE